MGSSGGKRGGERRAGSEGGANESESEEDEIKRANYIECVVSVRTIMRAREKKKGGRVREGGKRDEQ